MRHYFYAAFVFLFPLAWKTPDKPLTHSGIQSRPGSSPIAVKITAAPHLNNALLAIQYLDREDTLTCNSLVQSMDSNSSRPIELTLKPFTQVIFISDAPVLVNPGDQVDLEVRPWKPWSSALGPTLQIDFHGPQAGRQRIAYDLYSLYNLPYQRVLELTLPGFRTLLDSLHVQAEKIIAAAGDIGAENEAIVRGYAKILPFLTKRNFYSWKKDSFNWSGDAGTWLLDGQDIRGAWLDKFGSDEILLNYTAGWKEFRGLARGKNYTDAGGVIDLLENAASDRVKFVDLYFYLKGIFRIGVTPEVQTVVDKIPAALHNEDGRKRLNDIVDKYSSSRAGRVAFDFVLPDEKGKTVRLSDFRGKVVAMDFWGTWCAGCVKMLPYFEKVADSYKGDPNIVFVTVGLEYKGVEPWKKFLHDRNMEDGINLFLNDDGKYSRKLMDSFGYSGVPRYALIDRDGKFISAFCAYPDSREFADQVAAAVLANKRAGNVLPSKTMAPSESDSATKTRKAILRNVTSILEEDHYSPKPVNDSFSRAVWKKFLTTIDRDKAYFLKEDITRLQRYETAIDDQMHADNLEFFDTVMAILRKRVAEVQPLYHRLLATPVPLHSKGVWQSGATHSDWCASAQEREERWRRRITFFELRKLSDTAAKISEKDARERVGKWLDGGAAGARNILSGKAENDFFNTYINIMTIEMDPHTNYAAPVVARTFQEQMSLRFFGVGTELELREGDIYIKRIMTGGPASKSSLLRVGDRIEEVSDGLGQMVDVSGFAISEVAQMIRGAEGTKVNVAVRHADGTRSLASLIRGEIKQDEAGARSAVIRDGDKKIGYIFLPEFYVDLGRADGAHCSADVDKQVQILKAQGIDGLIIDLRGDPGGSLDEVLQMASLFLPQGAYVQTKDKKETKTLGKVQDLAPLYDGPMAVMVNEGSASASEIFSAVMQDYKRAVIIGSPTYGKGTAQSNSPMGKMGDPAKGIPDISYGSMRLTIEKFYRVTGAATQLKGVTPDVILPNGRENWAVKEKDNPTALPWDEIAAAEFTPVNRQGMAEAISRAKERAARDTSLMDIAQEGEWIRSNQDAPISLDIDQYRRRMEEMNLRAGRMVSLQQLPEGELLKVAPVRVVNDSAAAAPDQRYQKWAQGLGKDRYLSHAVQLMEDLILLPAKK